MTELKQLQALDLPKSEDNASSTDFFVCFLLLKLCNKFKQLMNSSRQYIASSSHQDTSVENQCK